MDFGSINWLAVLVSVLISILIGSVWYHPAVFYKPWRATLGRRSEDRPQSPVAVLYIFTIVAALVETIALALMLRTMGAKGAGLGAAFGCMLWLGFIAPTSLMNKLFSGQGWKGWLIEAGEHLVYILIAGAVIGGWR